MTSSGRRIRPHAARRDSTRARISTASATSARLRHTAKPEQRTECAARAPDQRNPPLGGQRVQRGSEPAELPLEEAEPAHEASAAVERGLALVAEHGGSISAEHGVGLAKRRFLGLTRTPEDVTAMAAVKRALDPAGILSPGVIL